MKNFFVVGLIAMASLATSCTSNTPRANEKIADYLYACEIDSVNFELCALASEHYRPKNAGACSEVRKGNFVGRNLDWNINKEASFIIKTNATQGRYASIGVSGCVPVISDSLGNAGGYSDLYTIVPVTTVDGINEKGLYVGVNVAPTGETSLDKSKWQNHKWGLGAAFTRPEATLTYCTTFVVRFLLDFAASVDEAKDLVESVNWFDPCGFPTPGDAQSFHWLICDEKKSAVLEFIDNKPVFLETTEVSKPSVSTIMTNFSNTLYADSTNRVIQDHGAGYERYDVLCKGYAATAPTWEGMAKLMESVWYTKCYTIKNGDPNFWLTDNYNDQYLSSKMYGNMDMWNDKGFVHYVDSLKGMFNDKSNWHTATSTLWYTVHTCIYDLAKRELHIKVSEGLDGQKDYYTCSINSTFPRPFDLMPEGHVLFDGKYSK